MRSVFNPLARGQAGWKETLPGPSFDKSGCIETLAVAGAQTNGWAWEHPLERNRPFDSAALRSG